MNLSSLPDIAGMVLLMAVLDRLRRKFQDSSVDLWMLGLLFILLEAVAVAVLHGSPALSRDAHFVALNAYVLAAVTFGWAAREDMFPGPKRLPMFAPPALPLLAVTSLYGLDITNFRWYEWVNVPTLVLGVVYLLLVKLPWDCRGRLLAMHLALWGPMTAWALVGNLRMMVYWGLACMYLLVGLSFRKRIRRGGTGGVVMVAGFAIWALCFLAHPFVRSLPHWNDLVEAIWTMQKFFVVIGMVLVLLEEQTRRLEEDAMHDALTGLPNRRLFDDRLLQALSRAKRTGLSAAVFVVDLDNFKFINDTYGHRIGDLVLLRAGQMLKSKIRSSDTLARCGGDEFSIIVNDLTRPGDCDRIASALRHAVASVEMPAEAVVRLAGSVGYALYPDDVGEAGELCELADVRMYKDKRRSSSINSTTAIPVRTLG